jgi:uncharacterized membrane protein
MSLKMKPDGKIHFVDIKNVLVIVSVACIMESVACIILSVA